jgi:hypothetical protein
MTRQRLELQTLSASVSAVKRPIVYTIDRTVPKQWVPWIQRGIEAWLHAFEQIGLQHAIVVHSIASARTMANSTEMPGCAVTWINFPMDGAQTSWYTDTTGAINSCSIMLNPGLIDMLRRYAFLKLGATNPAMRYPFSDSITGRLLQIAVEHEVGHSLGFADNSKGGVRYPIDSLHSPRFVHSFGHASSVMAYTLFNFVAQPTDHIAPDDLFTRIGPADVWALGIAYRPIPGAKTPQDELPTLERWRAVQDTAFAMGETTSMPNDASDAYLLGDDLVASATALSRTFAYTVPKIDIEAAKFDSATASSLAHALRSDVLNIWGVAMQSAGDLVGGKIPQRPYVRDSAQQRSLPVDSAQQVRALKFVLAHVMYGQDPLVQALFGRHSKDTSLMLFAKVPPGWSIEQWQRMQQLALHNMVRHWLSNVAGQAATTRVLPVLCNEVRRFEKALLEASTTSANRTTPEEKSQAAALLGILHPVTDSVSGICH